VALMDEVALRALVKEACREAIQEFAARLNQPAEYIEVAEAARIVAVAPDTIRTWIHEGRLPEHHAGRELRVKRAELEALLRGESPVRGREPTPEEAAHQFLARRGNGND
jgi:excisionase family DNA binding protein